MTTHPTYTGPGEFHGGRVPAGLDVFTVVLGDGESYEELDVLAPTGATDAEVRAIAAPIIAEAYRADFQTIVAVRPFEGMTYWT